MLAHELPHGQAPATCTLRERMMPAWGSSTPESSNSSKCCGIPSRSRPSSNAVFGGNLQTLAKNSESYNNKKLAQAQCRVHTA